MGLSKEWRLCHLQAITKEASDKRYVCISCGKWKCDLSDDDQIFWKKVSCWKYMNEDGLTTPPAGNLQGGNQLHPHHQGGRENGGATLFHGSPNFVVNIWIMNLVFSNLKKICLGTVIPPGSCQPLPCFVALPTRHHLPLYFNPFLFLNFVFFNLHIWFFFILFPSTHLHSYPFPPSSILYLSLFIYFVDFYFS